jgi:CRP-like cAMP-binding protein
MSTRDEEQRKLKGSGLLSGLTDEEAESFLAIARRIECARGSVIMHEGEPGDTMYLLATGEVDVTKNLTLKLGDREFANVDKSMNKIQATSSPIFGEMSLFGPEPRSATVTAAAPCVLYEITKADFDAFSESNPRIALLVVKHIAAILCSRVRRGNAETLKLSTALSLALSTR